MAFTHRRIANLSVRAADQVLARNVTVVNQALDGACNVFRRQMLALAEYRRAAKVLAPTKAPEDSQDECRANERGFGAAFVGKMAADKMEQIVAAIAAIVPAGPMTTRDYGNRHNGLQIITAAAYAPCYNVNGQSTTECRPQRFRCPLV
jgi:hypothetical protein